MQKSTINVGDIPMYVEYFKSDELTIKHSSEFIMLRNYDIINDIAFDKDIYFIEKSLYEKLWFAINSSGEFIYKNGKRIQNEDILRGPIIFPIKLNESKTYTNDIYKYLVNSAPYTLNIDEDNEHLSEYKDWYNLYESFVDEDGNNIFKYAQIDCDLFKIYKPHNRKQIDYIIEVTNLINDVTYHYFCQPYKFQPINSVEEKNLNNISYCEFIYFYVPNFEQLFDANKIWYKEDLNLMLKRSIDHSQIFNAYINYTDETISKSGKFINKNDNEIEINNLFPLSLLTEPFYIEEVKQKIIIEESEVDFYEDVFKDEETGESYFFENYMSKIYLETSKNSEYNIQNIPLTLILSHYDTFYSENREFASEAMILPSNVSFIKDNKFYISSSLSFDDDGILIIHNKFIYPKYPKYLDDYYKDDNITEFMKAYFYFNKIDNIDEYNEMINNDDPEIMELREDFINDIFNSELTELLVNKICGYIIEISTDPQFSNIIYRTQHATFTPDDIKSNKGEFAFALNDIFTSWEQYNPDGFYARCIFIDKYLSNLFFGNIVVITKEYFKYCINHINNHRLNIIQQKQYEINSMKIIDAEKDNFMFIDKINCVIKRDNLLNNNLTNINEHFNGGSNKILYKPIFFKINDVQKIKIRKTVSQNIGINLGDYLTKVETFKLWINDIEYTEIGRNDVFVIFKINGSVLTEAVGYYDILNQDNEYIASGTYELF